LIDHVCFVVTPAHARACAGFYELLGFARIEPPAGLGSRSIWLTRGGSSIHLMFRDGNGVDVAESGPEGAGHVALVVDSYDATIGALAAAGVEAEARSEYWGSPRSYVRDPAGNRVELMASPPSVA
jgi:catechol 2,3-dioxygenase-like lactoylglutathione lyase family enzyme